MSTGTQTPQDDPASPAQYEPLPSDADAPEWAKDADVIDRLNAKLNQIDKINNPNECHDWPGTIDDSGYPRMFVNGKNMRVHRMVATLDAGEKVPESHQIHHEHRRKSCVNRLHLEPLLAQHHQEIHKKTGEDSQNSKLTREQVENIIDLIHNTDMSLRAIGRKYDVDERLIRFIRDGERWPTVPRPSD